MNLQEITAADLEPYLNQTFSVSLEPSIAIELALISLTELGPVGRNSETPGRQIAFSAVFRGPASPLLPQHIYSFSHAGLGTFEIFITPIGPDAVGMRYEAIFN